MSGSAEHGKKKEGAVALAAEKHVSERRGELNRRLRKWTNMTYGGAALALAGLGLVFVPWAPIAWLGVGAYWTGAAVTGIGTLGVVGNFVKGLLPKNK